MYTCSSRGEITDGYFGSDGARRRGQDVTRRTAARKSREISFSTLAARKPLEPSRLRLIFTFAGYPRDALAPQASARERALASALSAARENSLAAKREIYLAYREREILPAALIR